MATPLFCPARAAFQHSVINAICNKEPKVHLFLCGRRIGKTKVLQETVSEYGTHYFGFEAKNAHKFMPMTVIDPTRPLVMDEVWILENQDYVRKVIKDHKSNIVIAMTPDSDIEDEWVQLADVVYRITYDAKDGDYGFHYTVHKKLV